MKKIIVLFFISILCLELNAQKQCLRFNENGEFKIVQFTDLHIIAGREESRASVNCINSVLDTEKPDLVILTGDVIFGTPSQKGLEMAIQPMIDRNIPFAFVFGNHDDEFGMSRKMIYEFVSQKDNHIGENVKFKNQDLMGYSNYILEIYKNIPEGDSKKDIIGALIYCFDSHSYDSPKKEAYGWISHNQVSWYRKESTKYTENNGGKPLQALSFFHIPLPEYKYVLAASALKEPESLLCGNYGEDPCCPQINTGLFAAFKEMGDVKGVFVGHDHNDDFAANYMDILLCYGRFSGCNTVYNDLDGNGARVVLLRSESNVFDTWLRLSDGTILDKISFPSK